MEKLFCLEDFEREAKERLKSSYWEYYSGGSCHGNTVRDNIEAYRRYRILPKVLQDVSTVDTSVTLFGQKVTFPVGASPTAHHALATPDGELATARACTRSGICMVQSMLSDYSIEEVTKGCEGQCLRWMQIQPIPNLTYTTDIVKRAEENGYKALVVTCDDPGLHHQFVFMRGEFLGTRFGNFPDEVNEFIFNDTESGMDIFQRYEQCIHTRSSAQSWEWIDWLRSVTTLPIVLKGILRGDDAREAVKHDIQGILVSNHGGRTVDYVPATIDVLPEIVEAVNGKVDVFVDGGIRHGTDVFKALALGAKCVFVGRPVVWGLACNGEDGVYRMLELLKAEFLSSMVFTGCTKVDDITSDYIRHASYYTHPFIARSRPVK